MVFLYIWQIQGVTARLLYNLGDYVRKYFFTDEKKGEYVYPIIDSSFINAEFNLQMQQNSD